MKEMFIMPGSAFTFDPDTRETDVVDTAREGIHRIYRVKEDCIVNVKLDDSKKKLEAKAGDIVITFYEREYPNRVIIVKSDEWNENFDTYEAVMQARKEEWAKKEFQEISGRNIAESTDRPQI